jgi:ABC-2 type transport system permease protein
MSARRVQAIFRKELRDYRRNRQIVVSMAVLPVSYGVLGVFVAAIERFAQPPVASALLSGPELLAQVLFTPLVAALSIWAGVAISTGGFHVTLGLALGLGAALLLVDSLGWRIVAPMLDRELLITGTRS